MGTRPKQPKKPSSPSPGRVAASARSGAKPKTKAKVTAKESATATAKAAAKGTTRPKPQPRQPQLTAQQKRHAELVELLEERRRALTQGVRQHLQRARDGDQQQQSEDTAGEGVSARDDTSLALAQIQAETLQRIDAALARLATGRYGDCAECGTPIPSQRLRALPFAVRCLECEATRESGRASAARRWNDDGGDVSSRSRRALDAI